ILQERVEAVAVGGKRALHQGKRMRSEVEEQKKKDLHPGDHHRGVGEEARIGLVAETENESIGGEQQRPEQQRAFLSGPEHREFIRTGQSPVAVMKNISDREIVMKGADDQNHRSEQNRNKRSHASPAGCLPQTFRTLADDRRERTAVGGSSGTGSESCDLARLRGLILECKRENACEK